MREIKYECLLLVLDMLHSFYIVYVGQVWTYVATVLWLPSSRYVSARIDDHRHF